MTNARKVKAEELEPTMHQLIREGFDTTALISDKLGFSRTYTTRVLNLMAYKGEIFRHEQRTNKGKRTYYTAGVYPCHDPFNITGRAYETHQPSIASH